jgi:hypothetical protein
LRVAASQTCCSKASSAKLIFGFHVVQVVAVGLRLKGVGFGDRVGCAIDEQRCSVVAFGVRYGSRIADDWVLIAAMGL